MSSLGQLDLHDIAHQLQDRVSRVSLENLQGRWMDYVPAVLLTSIVMAVVMGVGKMIYNLYFHPLAKLPGPFWGRCSLAWRLVHTTLGRFHRSIDQAHQKYGNVVRVSPNELSFGSVTSWKQIYGHPPPGQQTLVKSTFYDMYGSAYESKCIGSERNPKRHGKMKKNLVGAFSTKALVEQEDIINNCIDRFVEKLGIVGNSASKGLNMTKWYEMVSFDVLGEMAFGESFRSIEDEKPHFWSELIVSHLFFITVADNIMRLPSIAAIFRLFIPLTQGIRNKHSGYSRQQVEKRLSHESTRKDFLTNLTYKVHNGEVDKEEMTAHASTLVIAGGETTSTFLAAVTYYLLQTPDAYTTLKREIRDAYQSYDSINAASAQQLPYLQAVISEGLRIYPPGSQGFPRLSPGTEIDGHWIPEGTEVYTSGWTLTHDPNNFQEPMKFIPERWTDPNSTDIKEASQPFSLGPRGCLGRNFAYVEMSLILAKMFWRYELELVNPKLDWEGESKIHIMWSKPSLYVRFHERQAETLDEY